MNPAPGPWFYVPMTEEIADADHEVIGRFEPRSGVLASAAPDLLEELKSMVAIAWQDEWDKALTGRQIILARAIAAIRKAEGRSW